VKYAVIPTRGMSPTLRQQLLMLHESDIVPIIIPVDPDYDAGDAIYIERTAKTFGGWINQGLEYAVRTDPHPRVVVLNDDLLVDPKTLEPMYEELRASVVVGLSGWEKTVTPSPLRGHLFGINPNYVIMPEVEGLALWWWNTDDLYHQTEYSGFKVSFVSGVEYSHTSDNERPDGSWRYPREFEWSVQADHDYFWRRWHHLDPAHAGCYLSWWPDALPAGQIHRTDWS